MLYYVKKHNPMVTCVADQRLVVEGDGGPRAGEEIMTKEDFEAWVVMQLVGAPIEKTQEQRISELEIEVEKLKHPQPNPAVVP